MITIVEAKTDAYSALAHLSLHEAIDRHHGREKREKWARLYKACSVWKFKFCSLAAVDHARGTLGALSIKNTRCIYRGPFLPATELQGGQKPNAVFVFKFGSAQALALCSNRPVFTAPSTALEHWPSYRKRS